jgi:hypothetical protein
MRKFFIVLSSLKAISNKNEKSHNLGIDHLKGEKIIILEEVARL